MSCPGAPNRSGLHRWRDWPRSSVFGPRQREKLEGASHGSDARRPREAFEEGDLPYRVDIVDWYAIGDRFRSLIAAKRILLVEPVSYDPTKVPTPASDRE